VGESNAYGFTSKLVSQHELAKLLDEDMSEKEAADLVEAERVCRAFVAWELDQDSTMEVKRQLGETLTVL
jgi:DNA mismatch repair protein MSH5